jgi:PAS domain S-box-containing protein
MFGYPGDEIVGKPLTSIMPERYRDAHQHKIKKAISAGNPTLKAKPMELAGLRKDDTEFPLDLSLTNWETKDGIFFTGIIRDISERKQADEALRKAHDELEMRVQERTAQLLEANALLKQEIAERKHAEKTLRVSEEKYSRLVESSFTGIFIVQDGKIAFANKKFAEIHGYAKEELLGMESSKILQQEDRDYVNELREKRLKGENVPGEYEIMSLKKGGGTIWVNRRIALTSYNGRPAVLGNIEDITHRKLMEEELRESEKELRHLSSRLLAAQEEERKRIAIDLHDSIAQSLSAIKFSLETRLGEIGNGTPPSGTSLEDIISRLQDSIDETRTIMTDLRPSLLDDLGILATINWHCREFQKIYTGINVEKKIAIQEVDVPDSLKIVIYRVLQEASSNIAKHSHADLMRLSLKRTDEKIELTIDDNGTGYDVEHTLSGDSSGRGLGLAGMRERTKLSGGSFSIQSRMGSGTTIRASWQCCGGT